MIGLIFTGLSRNSGQKFSLSQSQLTRSSTSTTHPKIFPDQSQMPAISGRARAVASKGEEARPEVDAARGMPMVDTQIKGVAPAAAKINNRIRQTIEATVTKASLQVNSVAIQGTSKLAKMAYQLLPRIHPPLRPNASHCGTPISRAYRRSAVVYD